MAEMSKAEIEQAVAGQKYCDNDRQDVGDCAPCPLGNFAMCHVARSRALLALAAERDGLAAEVERLVAEICQIDAQALGALADAGVCTPAEGYRKAGWSWMAKHIKDIANERDDWKRIATAPPAAGAMPTRLDVMMAVAPSVPACYRRATSIEGIENTYWLTVDEWVQDVGQRADALLAAAQSGGAS